MSLGTGQDPDPWAPAFRATRGWPGRMQAARPWAARAAGVALQGQEEEQVHRGGLRASDPLLPSGALERWLGRAWGFLPCPASATAPGRTGDASWSPGRPWEGTLPCRAPHPPSAEHRLVWLQAGSSAGPCSPVVLLAALPPSVLRPVPAPLQCPRPPLHCFLPGPLAAASTSGFSRLPLVRAGTNNPISACSSSAESPRHGDAGPPGPWPLLKGRGWVRFIRPVPLLVGAVSEAQH